LRDENDHWSLGGTWRNVSPQQLFEWARR
jgi:hypothetical protein